MILDVTEPIEVPEEAVKDYSNYIHQLKDLALGLTFINAAMTKYEEELIKITGGHLVLSIGHISVLDQVKGIPRSLAVCYFHWYSVSAVNFVRTIGWIGSKFYKNINVRDYTESIVGDLIGFRNKVSAHFAFSSRDKRDNPAERQHTASFPINLRSKRVVVNTMTFHSGEHDTSELKEWNIPEVHAQLIERYPVFELFKNFKLIP